MEKKTDNEALLKILDAIDGAIYLADPDTYEILFTNRKFKSIWGHQELTEGTKCFKLLQGMDAPCPFCTNEIIFNKKKGEVHVWEFRNKLNNRWYRCFDRAVEWTGGKIVRMELAIDITREKEAISDLEVARDRYRLAESVVNLGIWDWRVQENEVYYSPIWKEQVGFKDDELPNTFETWKSLLHPDDLDKCMNALQDYVDHPKEIFIQEFRLRHKLGHYIWVRNEANSEQDAAGKVIRMFGAHTDITKRRNAEIKLRLNEAKYRSVFESANDAFFIFNEKGEIVEANVAATEYYGYTRDELIGKDAGELVHPDYREKLSDLLREVRDHGLFRGETVDVRKDGTTFPTQVTGTMIMFEEEPHFLAVVRDETETKAAEKMTRESERKFHSLYHNAPDMYATVSPESGKILECNRTLLEKTGYTKEDLVGKPVHKLYDISASEQADIAVTRLSETGEIQNLDLVLKTKKGGLIDVSLNVTSINEEDDDKHLNLYAWRDITEQKILRKKIERSEERLKNAQKIAKMGSWRYNIQSNHLHWSDEIYRIFGRKPNEVEPTLEGFLEHVHPDDREMVNTAYANSLETKEPYEIIHRLSLRDGSIRYVREMCDTEFDEDGTPLISEGIVQDITDMKLKEKQVLEEKLFNDSVLEAMPGIFYLFDEQGKFLKWNNTLSNLSGISYDEVGLKSPLDFIAKKHRKKVGSAIENAFRTGEVLVEADFLAKGRENIPFYFSGIRVQFEGKYLLLGVGIDISKRKQAEKKLEILALELKRSNIELERFASVASHDLQEPLRMVASYTQLLEKRYKDKIDDKASRYIHYAVDGAERMQILINDLLQYSRISTRGDTFRKIDMNDVVHMAVENLQNRIDRSGASFEIQELPLLSGDAGQLTRLFMNLISNALKFAREGIQPQIKINAEKEKRHWKFSVSDNGIGIDQKYEDKVFVIFQRLHSRDDYEGTGIGLAICKRIVERHGGKIWFDSENETGTTFFFTLPLNVVK